MNRSFHRDVELARREVCELVDSETLALYRRAALRCTVPVQIVVKATEGQPFIDAEGHSQLVSLGSTFVVIAHPENSLSEFREKVLEVTLESTGGE